MGEPYVRSEFKLTAEIGGIPFNDIVSISATFGLNSIPTASLHLASGKSVQNGQDATVHYALDSLKQRDIAKVTLTIKTTDGEQSKMMPDGDYIIFEGYYAGIGYQRSHTNSTYTIHLLHWIDDLNCSSALNGNWLPGAPHDMAQSAVNYSLSQDGSGAGMIAPLVELAPDILTLDHMATDFWGDCLKPIFFELANMRHLTEQGDKNEGAAANGKGGATNKAAQEALDKIPGKAPFPATLPLNLGSVEELVIFYSVQDGVSSIIKNGIAYSSFWSKLVGELGASFLFGISPSVQFANVFPYFGGLSQEWMTIHADEYNYASFNANMANLIESVNIFYTQQSNTGFENSGPIVGPYMNYYEPWGVYPPVGQRDLRGQILARGPPVWLANVAPQSLVAPESALGAGSAHKGADGPAAAAAPTATEAEKTVQESGILNKFAEHWYKSSILSQRSGEMSGKLRFDIAPGSTIKIEAPDSALSGENNMFATVTQVSYVINAEQHAAGTSFSLINVRTEAENADNRLTSAVPPLYNAAWPGGPLTVEY